MSLIAGGSSLTCDHCKTVVIIHPDDAGIAFIDKDAAGLNCPVCATPLWNATVGGVPVRACKKCSGTLIPMGALEAIVEALRAANPDQQIPSPANPADLERKIDCPKCQQRLDVHFYLGGGGAVMGTCERCEMDWLDGGMLMRIVHAPHHENQSTKFW